MSSTMTFVLGALAGGSALMALRNTAWGRNLLSGQSEPAVAGDAERAAPAGAPAALAAPEARAVVPVAAPPTGIVPTAGLTLRLPPDIGRITSMAFADRGTLAVANDKGEVMLLDVDKLR